jgi:hypothetical protein
MGEEYNVIIQGPRQGKALDEGKAFVGWGSNTPLGRRTGEYLWSMASVEEARPGEKFASSPALVFLVRDLTVSQHRYRIRSCNGGIRVASEVLIARESVFDNPG